MKKALNSMLLLLLVAALFTSCNNSGTTSAEPHKDTTVKAVSEVQMNYPYTIEHPDYWQIGSQQNTMNALSSLKAWENNNLDECLKYFADSVHVQFDGLDKMMSADSLKKMFTPPATVKNHSIKMQDWESVISNDKKDEYVTLWYRQYTNYMNGKQDSVDVINDIKMKDGKIIGLDEYRRNLD